MTSLMVFDEGARTKNKEEGTFEPVQAEDVFGGIVESAELSDRAVHLTYSYVYRHVQAKGQRVHESVLYEGTFDGTSKEGIWYSGPWVDKIRPGGEDLHPGRACFERIRQGSQTVLVGTWKRDKEGRARKDREDYCREDGGREQFMRWMIYLDLPLQLGTS